MKRRRSRSKSLESRSEPQRDESRSTSTSRRRRKRSEGEFDPERFTGKHTWKSRLEDIGYFCRLQWAEIKSLLRHAKRLSHEMLNEVMAKLRK